MWFAYASEIVALALFNKTVKFKQQTSKAIGSRLINNHYKKTNIENIIFE